MKRSRMNCPTCKSFLHTKHPAEHRRLKMFAKFICWTIRGEKHATTRLSKKPLGDYTLGTQQPYHKFDDYGVIVRIHKIVVWKIGGIRPKRLLQLAKLEGFKSSEEFVKELYKINAKRIDGKKLNNTTPLYTHYYKVLKVPARMRQLYED